MPPVADAAPNANVGGLATDGCAATGALLVPNENAAPVDDGAGRVVVGGAPPNANVDVCAAAGVSLCLVCSAGVV